MTIEGYKLNDDNPEVVVPPVNAIFKGEVIADGELERFRNIKYGSIPGRFSLPEPFRYNGDNLKEVDSTKQGPICPQAVPYKDSLIGIPEEMVRPFDLIYDEFECLNLMISRPNTSKHSSSSSLPVVVWIHGGANMAGSPYRTVCDPTDWVLRSVKIGKPIIFVSLQFRVHMFGSLPYNGIGNFILHDQRLGIEWVHHNIEFFGGDPSQITVIGQSSGSCCVAAQACAPGANNFFKRVALMSGSISSMPCVSLDDYEIKTKELIRLAEVTSIEGLRTIPWERLVDATTRLNFTVALPVDDGYFLAKGQFNKPEASIESIIISDCIEDGYFFAEYMDPDGEQLYNKIQNCLGIDADSTLKLLDAYNIVKTNPSTSQTKLCDIITDALFCHGNELMDTFLRKRHTNGSTRNVKVFRQLFDAVNPFNPSFGNNHMVEILYLFNSYSKESTFDDVTKNLQSRWISFFYGEDPWDEDHALLVYEHSVTEVPIEDRKLYRRLDAFDLLPKLNTLLLHQLCGYGW